MQTKERRVRKLATFGAAIALSVSLISLVSVASAAIVLDEGVVVRFTESSNAPNGAWSWFEGERVVVDGSRILVSSVSHAAVGDAERGDIDVHWYDAATRTQGSYELSDQLNSNDHSSAALWVRPDGRYLAAYSRHDSDDVVRFRTTVNPNDPTQWGVESTVNVASQGSGVTTAYSNLYHLQSDNGGAGRLYHISRNENSDPNVLVSDDQGANWVDGGKLLTQGDSTVKPYLRYAANEDAIHFTTTDGHPGFQTSSIYHGYIRNGMLHDSFGNVVDDNIGDASAVSAESLTSVFPSGLEFDGIQMTRAWTTDTAIDGNGNPYAVFTARADDNTGDHRFFYGRFNGLEWSVSELAAAGAFLAPNEDYTGLAALDPNDPDQLYISTTIDPRTGLTTDRYELYRGRTDDGGITWSWEAVTANSIVDNLRPIVPDWDLDNSALLWLEGNYNTWTEWDTQVVGIIKLQGVPEPSALGFLAFAGLVGLWHRQGRR